MKRRRGELHAEGPPRRPVDPERAPRQHRLHGDAGLVAAEVRGDGGGDRVAASLVVATELCAHERRALLRKDLGWNHGEAEATWTVARVDAPVDTQRFPARE